MCLLGATSILIALLFTITIRYLFQGNKIKKIDWDMATVTASDYTVEINIKKTDYEKWKRDVYEAEGGILERMPDLSPALALKEHMIEEITTNLDEYVARIRN